MNLATTLLTSISTTLAQSARPEDALREIADTIGRLAQIDLVRLSIQNPQRGVELAATFKQPGQAQTGLALNRELRSGAYTYGHIEILASRPAIRAVELYQFLGALESMLLNYSILQANLAEKARLRSTLHLAQEELRIMKLGARAGSLLARYGFTPQAAQEFLEKESRHARVPLTIAAERFIAQQKRREIEAA